MKQIKKYNQNGKYLLGINKEDKKVYLTKPSWDCSWYWGFGYIDMPDSHSHWKGEIVGQMNKYDFKHFII